MSKRSAIEDVYTLSPMQEGMLFHVLYAPDSGVYVGQFGFVLEGSLDAGALERAWQGAVARHEVLRAGFAWEGVARPVQVVRREVRLPFLREDWRELDPAGQRARLDEFLAADRARGFDLKQAPLIRLALFRTGEQAYQLVWTHHHLVLDGWSLSVLFGDVLGLYMAYARGEAPQVTAGRRFRDYVAWLERQDRARAERYWREALAGFGAATPLPLVARRGAETGHGVAALVLDGERTGALREQARRLGVTLSTLVQGAWALLLARYAGEDDVVFGATVSGRPVELPGVEETVGPFINTLPVRARLDARSRLGEWLSRLQQEQVEAREYEYAPLAEVQRWSEVPGGESLFESLVVFENYPVDQALEALEQRTGGLRVRGNFGREQASYPLVLAAEAEARLKADLRYERAVVEEDAAQRLLEQVGVVLETMAADPERPLWAVSLLRDAERARLLEASAAPAPGLAPACLHDLVSEAAERTPDAPALVFGGDTLTFSELERRSSRLAHYLRGRGVGPEVRVGLCLDRGLDLVVGALGVAKAGGAYVPLDPAYPAERLAYTLADSGATVLLTHSAVLDVLPAFAGDIVRVDRERDEIAAQPGHAPSAGVDVRNTAYVVYTSGSTGRPKGVAVEHASLANTLLGTRERFGFEAGETFLALASPAFDIWAFEVFAPLLAGACVRLLPRESVRDVEKLASALESAEAVHAVPALMRELAERVQAGPGTLPRLRRVFVGGDAVAPDLLALLRRSFPAAAVRVLYGPTEAAILAAATLVEGEGCAWQAMGRALPGAGLHVCDAGGELLPAGVPGELYIGGAGVARGYLGRADLTAERFVPDAFGGEPAARLYRTGDRVRRRADGELEFLGRTDQQVKIRGFRIEPGEVEAALAEQAQVREAAVTVREDGPGRRRLVAYVVPEAGARLSGAQVREALAGRLPEHMVPGAVVVLEALPLTPTGKVDRRALPAPEGAAETGRYVAPRGGVEEILAGIWAEVLGVERVGAEDDFFVLGGDSILSIQVVSRARKRGLKLSPRQLFEHPTVARLAEVVEWIDPQAAAEAQGPVTGPAPLTPVQASFFAEPNPARDHFNQALLLVPRDALDAGLLARAADALESHHDALRLRFRRGADGAWTQTHAAPGRHRPLAVFDLAGLAGRDRRGAVEAAAEQVQRSLDLARGPLLRMGWFDLGAGEAGRLLAVVHHLAVDGVSWRILLEDLETAYGQLSRGGAVDLPAKTTSWQSWARRLAEHARSEALAAEAGFWTRQAGESVAALPVDDAAAANTVSRSRSVSVRLSGEETEALLREVPQAYRTQVDEVLLTALATALGRWTGERRVRIDLEGHGREEEAVGGADLSRTVGWFTSVYPVVLELPETREAGAALKAVKEQLRAVPGRGIGHGLLRHVAGMAELAAAPEAEVAFNYLGQLDRSVSAESFFAFAPESAGSPVDGRGRRTHLLEVTGSVQGGRLEVQVGYAEGVHRRETVERLAEGFAEELRGLIAHCRRDDAGGCTPSDFPLAGLGQDAVDALLGSAHGVEDVYPLSPMQEGMLFHVLYAPDSGVYVGQFGFVLEGSLDAGALERAWQGAVARHEVLRAGFAWEGVARPVQVVRREARLPFLQEDWRGLGEAGQRARLDEFLAADRARGFDLKQAPLIRLALFRTGEREHQLVWTHHHLVLDGWSLSVLFGDVLRLYMAYARGEAPQVTAGRRFRDYVAWLERQDRARAERYWREALSGFGAATPLPLVARRGAESGHGLARLLLEEERTEALREQARRMGVTLSTLAQGAWALLLARYAGEDDVVFGATVSGRPAELPGVEEMVGPFINTLPVRARLDARSTPGEWLSRLQQEQVEAREHEYAPLAEVQRWSDVPAGESLFESLVVFENYPIDQALEGQAERTGGLRVRGNFGREQASYPLVLAVEAEARLKADLRYERAVVEESAAERLLEQVGVVLETMAADPERPLWAVSLLRDAERAQLLEASAAPAPVRDAACLHDLVSEAAERTPDAPALAFGAETLTFSELERRSSRLAHYLRGRGVGPEVRVGLCLDRGLDLVVGALGVAKAGGAYVPLDPAYPAERLAYTLADSGATVLLTHSAVLDVLPAFDGETVRVDREREAIAAQPEHAPSVGVDVRNAAYVVYTSGSTGRPKGVAVEHASLANTLLGTRERFGLQAGETFLALASPAFDIWAFEVFAPLLAGACVRLLPRESVRDVEKLASALESAEAVHAVPALMRELAERVHAGPGTLPRLRRVFVGGDAVAPDLLALLRRAFPAAAVRVLYGPTEAAILAAATLVEGEGCAWQAMGCALPGAGLHVCDAGGELLPAGVPGELYIGGAGVARGYLGRAELTAERFVPDAFGGEPGARLYRTGDRVRRRADGELEFLGRTDQQVKIRGFRIEPGEVEAALAEQAQVREAAVTVREDGPGRRRLVAYVVPEAGARLSGAQVREALAGRLPEHMVPGAVVVLEALPLTPTGKVDRRALPAPEGAAETGRYVAPRGGVEEILAGIWAEVLGVERVGAEDGFFDLGGHSLLATRVVSRARQALGVEVPLRALFDAPTVAGLAAHVEALRSGGAPAAGPLERAPRDRPLPLSFAQQRLWVVDRLEPGSPAYNMPYALRLRGELDAAVLGRALDELASRHETLRTTFAERGGVPVQVVRPPAPRALPAVDLRALPAGGAEREALRIAGEDAVRPFDLETGPLLRSTLLRLGDGEHVLCFTMHHVASDGWSMDVLVRELSALYAALGRGEPSPLPELAVQYADYSVWQRARLAGAELERQVGYWKARLAGAPPLLEIPTDRPRVAGMGARAGRHSFALSAEASRDLRTLARREGVTLYMVLLAAWQALLGRYAGQDDVVVGSPVAGRTRAETEGLIGFFVNMLAMRGDLGGDPTWRELLRRTREEALGAYAHQEFPFELLVDELATERSLTHTPVFQVVFVLQRKVRERLVLGGTDVRPFGAGAGVVRLDLELTVEDGDGQLAGMLDFREALFDAATVERLAGHLLATLEAAAADPARRFYDVPLLRGAERAQVLEAWNDTVADYPRELFHELFAEQAARVPDAPAVDFDGRSLTYAELDRRSARLAHHLRRRGAGPEVRVGLCLERGVELLVGVLGVLRSGAAYVPLDPSHPAGRLAAVLADAGAPLLLTEAGLLERLPAFPGVVVCLDRDAAEIAARPDTAPAVRVEPRSAAYVVYTSGSTGTPKGVVVEHAGLAHFAATMRRAFELRPGDVTLGTVSVAFDIWVFEALVPLAAGAAARLLPLDRVRDGAALVEELGTATVLAAVPALIREAVGAARAAGTVLDGVRSVMGGGDAVPPELWPQMREVFPNARLYVGYGPTEATVIATRYTIPEGVADGAPVIGRPLPDVRAYVLDGRGSPLPAGVPGELCLGGVGVSRGYLGRPELTADRFVPDAFGREPGARLYRTGDRARWRADGELEYLGRLDTQVKVRGFRIELGEVEAALLAHPAVRAAAAAVREDAGRKRLVAYVVPEEGAASAPAAAELRELLSARLPEYMVPGAFVFLERLPLSAAGKLDRRALPASERELADAARVAPRGEVEAVLAEVWAGVLGLASVGVEDSFFELGGDSILAIQAVSRARLRGLELTPRQLFEQQTVARLAEVVRMAGDAAAAEDGPVTGEVPLTPVQRRFFARPVPARHHFNQALLLRPREALEPAALARAAAALEAHHDALRLRFRQGPDGAWTQSFAPAGERAPLAVLDLSGLPEGARRRAVEAAAEQAQRSLDLARGPLLRMVWLHPGAGDTGRLLAVVHHLAVDGVSWRILLEDLETAYGQLARGGEARLPARTTSWKAWAERLAGHARSGALAAEADFWTRQARADVAPLPVDDAGADDVVARSRAVGFRLDEEETAALLREVPAAYRTRIDEVLLCALAGAVRRWTGERRLRVALEGHGREEETVGGVDLSRTVGWFTTLYPVLLELPRGGGAGASLRAVKEQLRAVPGRGIGHGLLRWAGGPAAEELGEAEVSFNYLGQFDRVVSDDAFFAFAPESAGAASDGRAPRDFRLEVTGSVREGRLDLQVGYAEGVHRRATVERLAEWYAEELRGLIAHCRSAEAGGWTPSDFPLAGLEQGALDALLGSDRGVEDVYPLTPMQEGLLFHTLLAPGSGMYVGQSSFQLSGPLDVEALERAWQGAVARHEALRAGFAWEGVPRPLQVVRRRAEMQLQRADWRGLDGAALAARLQEFLAADRARGFDPARAPLMRLALFRLGDEEHRLVWTHHHLIFDGWSLSLIFRDVLELYAAHARGEAPQPAPAQRYRDYVGWLERQDHSRAERFWREALAGFAAPTPLPVSHAAARETGADLAGKAGVVLSAEEVRALRERAAPRGLTLSTRVQGAWALLLARYAGEDDVVFGATVSGRPAELPGVEGMVGLFINTLPVRVRVDPAAAAGEWLALLQEQQVSAREYEYTPLVDVKKWSDVPDGEALFDSLVVFENFPVDRGPAAPVGGLRVRTIEGIDRANYPLILAVDAGEALALEVRFDRARVDADTAERMVGHLRAVLLAMAEAPDRPLSALSLADGAERARVLETWNATAADFPRACLHELVAEQAARTPDAPAVTFGGEALTYAELQRRANRLAHHLRGLGVGPETRVGMCLERSAETAVAVLGILGAGGAWVPLDPAYPAERLRHMLADSGAALVVTRSGLAGRVDGHGAAPVLLDADAAAIAAAPDTPPAAGVWPENAAYVIYTSGSTGTPKGVVVPHLGLGNVARAQARELGVAPGDRVLQFASSSFDASVFETVMALANGGTLCMGTRAELAPGPDLVRFLRDHRVNAATLPPSALAVLPHAALPDLRVLATAGEALPAELADRWAPGRALFNLYGPTEATIWSTTSRCREGGGRPAIGRPVANTAAYVLDAALQPAPVGVAGELYVGGAGVARGYLGRPDLTAERYVPDPFGGVAGARLYRTGDRVRWLPAGELEYLGRVDGQVKLRGFRIEPGEVEAVLRGHPGVLDAAVVVREDEPGDRRLVGYVAAGGGAELSPRGLRGWLEERLPEHMVPSAVVVLEALPLTPSGKTDRRALPRPEAGGGASPAAARTPVEEMLGGICAEVLGVQEVGGGDSFFELGGHSLLAIQVVSRIHEVLGVEVPLQLLFEEPTVSGLAERIGAMRAEGGAAPPAAIGRVPRGGPLPLSFAQQRLWMLDRMEPGSTAYNLPFALRLRGRLDEAALRGSLDALVARHEALRTTFAESGGAPAQVVHPPAPVPLPTLDLRAHPAPEAEALRLAREEAGRPFDLARGPLLRSTLLRLGDDDHALLFTLHHVVSDGWSTDVMVREVSALYAALSRGEEPSLPELPVQYADFAVWQREWLAGEVLDAQLAYWRERLAGAPPVLEIPTDRPRAAGADPRAASHAFGLPAETAQALRALSREEGTTLFMTLLAGWQVLLGRWADEDDVVVGTPITGRTRRETEGLIGFFVNMLALRTDLAGDPAWTELLARVREAALGAYDHQGLPFERVVEELAVERSATHTPVFQATFALEWSGTDGGLSLGGVAVEPFGREEGAAKFDLALTFRESGAGLDGTLLYRAALFDADTMARMAGHLAALLEAMAAGPSRRLSEAPLLRGAERARVLETWNATSAPLPRERLHELFTAQAARTPAAVAVRAGGAAATYAELERRSGRLARLLRERGVGPEVRVALCLERGVDAVAGLLGILRAGGVYVPLDPAYPAERLEYVLQDSGAAVLLAEDATHDLLPGFAGGRVSVEPGWESSVPEGGAPEAGTWPESAAYVIYTSGSTGRPKGVVTTHAGAANLLVQAVDTFRARPGTAVLHAASLSFDASLLEVFVALASGGTLHVADRETTRSPERLAELLLERGIEVWATPPALLEALPHTDFPALRLVVSGGDRCSGELAARWSPGRSLMNMYGPTETTIYTAGHECAQGAAEAPPLGRPVANARAYVLDRRGEPVPAGVAGEIHVGGAGVARGYLGRPELTAERFVPDPFGPPGGRLYRTGDRGRWRGDGELEFLGRVDGQVKIRGFRIEPGEIESVLREQPGVREALVVAREDSPGDRRLVAYVVPAGGAELQAGALRARLAERLPEHMVPSAFMALERLPLYANGKVDRRALPAPAPAGEAGYVAPRTAVEEMLCAIWEEVLGVERVGVEDSFFALGGHSLLATHVASRARDAFGVEVPLRELFATPTVAALAASVEELMLLSMDDEELAGELLELES